MNVTFFGTPTLAAKILMNLFTEKVGIVAVVTQPPSPQKRSHTPLPSEVERLSQQINPHLPVYTPRNPSDPAFIANLAQHRPDLFVVVAYGHILKPTLLAIPRLGAINLHTSLLPKYRGASPIHAALLAGDQVTGVSVIEMVARMDAGAILCQKRCPIPSDSDRGELETRLIPIGTEALLEVIDSYRRGDVTRIEQSEEHATYVTKITPDMGRLDWTQPAQRLHQQVRAFSPTPGAYSMVQIGKQTRRMKIYKTRLLHEQEITLDAPSDRKEKQANRLIVTCGAGALEILQLQLEGKRSMDTPTFLNGLASPITFS